MNEDVILLTEKDYVRIKGLLDSQKTVNFENLEQELDRAKILKDKEVPTDLVTMNSKVRYLNVDDRKEVVVTIVYPSESNLAEGKVSVLASLGSALIGLRVNQEINWPFPDGKDKTLKILEILYQPESSGHLNL